MTNEEPSVDTEPNTEQAISESQVEIAQVNQGASVRASWKFSLDAIRANIRHFSPEAKELLVWSFERCIDPAYAMHFEDFCEQVGYSKNTLYKIYTGKYLHPETKAKLELHPKLIKALRTFKRLELARAKLGRKKFVETPTAKRIFHACELARESGTPVIVIGASHIGKTEALEKYCEENNHGTSRMIAIESGVGSNGLIRATAKKLGVSPTGNVIDLTERIRNAITPNMLLVFDELHLLAYAVQKGSFLRCVEWIRRLWDKVKCGMVFTFTPIGYAKLEREVKNEFQQLFNRSVHLVELGAGPSVKDIKAIVEDFGLEMPAKNEEVTVAINGEYFTDTPYKILQQLAAERGLKVVIERIRLAIKLAADVESELSWEHFVGAHVRICKNAGIPANDW